MSGLVASAFPVGAIEPDRQSREQQAQQCHQYEWRVHPRAKPGATDASCEGCHASADWPPQYFDGLFFARQGRPAWRNEAGRWPSRCRSLSAATTHRNVEKYRNEWSESGPIESDCTIDRLWSEDAKKL